MANISSKLFCVNALPNCLIKLWSKKKENCLTYTVLAVNKWNAAEKNGGFFKKE